MWYIPLVIPEIKCECHSSLTVTNWTRHVQSTMLEHTRMNQILKRVLGITGPGNLSHLTCIPSDLTSISQPHTSLPLHRTLKPSHSFQHSHTNQISITQIDNGKINSLMQPRKALPRAQTMQQRTNLLEKLKPTQNWIWSRFLCTRLKTRSFCSSRINEQKVTGEEKDWNSTTRQRSKNKGVKAKDQISTTNKRSCNELFYSLFRENCVFFPSLSLVFSLPFLSQPRFRQSQWKFLSLFHRKKC